MNDDFKSLIKNDYDLELFKCKVSPFYFITNYCKTLDTDDKSDKIKLIPKYPYIKEIINAIHADQNNLIEKSRQMTVSWISQAYNIWGLLFGIGYTALNLSRKEDLVDSHTHKSLFGKMRIIFNNLPPWMIEAQFGYYDKANKIFNFLNVVNKKRNNSIEGESANTDAGRGGSVLKVFGDEFGFIPRSESVYAAFDDSCPNGKNLITTPPYRGKKCCFYRLRDESLKGENNFKIVRVHWSKHPLRDQNWYKEACKGKTADQIARELDIDWHVAVKGRIYERWNSNDHVIEYQHQSELPLNMDFDFGIGESPVSIGYSQDLRDGEIVYFEDAEYFKQPVTEIINKIYNTLFKIKYIDNIDFITKLNKVVDKEKDLDKRKIEIINCVKSFHQVHLKLKNIVCYGDPSGKAKGATGKSWISEFHDFFIIIQYTTNAKKRDLEYGHLLVDQIVTNNKLLCTSNCNITIDALENYKRKTDSEGNVLDTMLVSDDEFKHRADGIRYKIINTRATKRIDDKDLRTLPAGL